jgi:hypothetical protein
MEAVTNARIHADVAKAGLSRLDAVVHTLTLSLLATPSRSRAGDGEAQAPATPSGLPSRRR